MTAYDVLLFQRHLRVNDIHFITTICLLSNDP